MFGWPVLVHYCDSCNYNTPVEYSTSVWTQKHTCTHCGLSARGADIAGESKGTMNSTQHDELAQLFAQSMQLQHQTPTAKQQQQQQQPPVIEQVQQILEEKGQPQIHFASAHYTPNTAHVRAETQSEPAQSPPPPYREAIMPDAMADMLQQNSIDPSALLPNQIDLFLNADYEQRLRLLELWRISPPSYPLEQHLQDQWMQTSVEREEHEARQRYEQQMQHGRTQHEEHMLDMYVREPVSPIGDGPGFNGFPPAARMRAASIAANTATNKPTEAEPYIVNGYEIAAARGAASPRAVEPVYAAAGLWSAPTYEATVQQAAMEDQYGMIEQIRCHADWERMNQQAHQQHFVGMHGGMDEDMEL